MPTTGAGLRKAPYRFIGGYKAGHFKTKLEKRMEAYASHGRKLMCLLRKFSCSTVRRKANSPQFKAGERKVRLRNPMVGASSYFWLT